MKIKIENRFFKTPRDAVVQSLTYIVGAFGLVAALAWNEAIRTALNHFFQAGNTVISLFLYAILVTILAVLVTIRLNKLTQKMKEEEKEYT